jgi:GT2 family glycosyltransferase
MTRAPASVRATCLIVAFHRVESLTRLLAALAHPDLSVVVMNVEADPGVGVAARAAGARAVDVVDNPGYGAAVNRGVALAEDDVVVFLNDDASIDADSVLRLAAVVAGGEADVAVPRVVNGDGELERTVAAIPSPVSLAREWALLPDRPVECLRRHVRVEKWRTPRAPERIDAASAVVVAARRELLRLVPMPEDYFLYWEESEWFWRLRARGAVVQYRPDATCVHDGGRSDVRPAKSRLLARNAVRCVRRTQGRVAALAALMIVIGWNARLLGADSVRALGHPTREGRSRVGARWAGFWAALTSWGEVL